MATPVWLSVSQMEAGSRPPAHLPLQHVPMRVTIWPSECILSASIWLPSGTPEPLGVVSCPHLCILGRFHNSGHPAGAHLPREAAVSSVPSPQGLPEAQLSAGLVVPVLSGMRLPVLTGAQGEKKNEREGYKMVPAKGGPQHRPRQERIPTRDKTVEAGVHSRVKEHTGRPETPTSQGKAASRAPRPGPEAALEVHRSTCHHVTQFRPKSGRSEHSLSPASWEG